MDRTKLESLLPYYYNEFYEFNVLMSAEETLFDAVADVTQEAIDNQYVLTSNIHGIEVHESSLSIVADPITESLEFRRDRIMNRLSMTPPFTMRFLKKKLNEIIGKGKWTARLDPAKYTLYIESAATTQEWLHEIMITMTKIKPANIVFMNTPLLSADVTACEKIEKLRINYNYRLGTIWNLGQKPFAEYENLGVIKMPEAPSIKAALLNNVAEFTAMDVKKVRLNGTYLIDEFTVKRADQENSIISYLVSPSVGISDISKIELLDLNSKILTSTDLFMPLIDDVTIKHTIKFKGGN